jgi:hypothetical protein
MLPQDREKPDEDSLTPNGVRDHFPSLDDPRVVHNRRQAPLDIVLLTVRAVVSGAEGWEAVKDFGRGKLDRLGRFAPLENRYPRMTALPTSSHA